jgi:hypothetical protein
MFFKDKAEAMMIILTVILFVLGVICFSKTRLRAE